MVTSEKTQTYSSTDINPNKELLREYFEEHWPKQRIADWMDLYRWTGKRLIDEVEDHEHVLDVGCGSNPFKGKIKNLHGIDITDIGCDEVVAIEDFETEKKYDVAFVLGSINFGDWNLINKQVRSLVNALKPKSRIYWRCNAGQPHENSGFGKQLPFWRWNLNHHIMLTQMHPFEVTEFMPDDWTTKLPDGKEINLKRQYYKWESK